MPTVKDLPIPLAKLARRHAVEISHTRFGTDVERLIQALKKNVPGPGQRSGESLKPQAVQDPTPPAGIPPEGMVKVPKGPYLYGEPMELVTIDYDYWIDVYPVTNAQYRQFIEAGGYNKKKYWSHEGWKWKDKGNRVQPRNWEDPQGNQSNHPVVGVSYYEAEAFADWAGKQLPTEQEWEKAARGLDGREFPWGNDFDPDLCNFQGSRIKGTTPVTKYVNGASPYGCYDMGGNVWEWTTTWFDEVQDNKVRRKVRRGGSWGNVPDTLRCANRPRTDPRDSHMDTGFRCVQDVL